VSIETDTNNDGMVSAAELGNATSFTVKAAFDATKVAVGDRVVFSDGTNTKTVTLTQADITNGFAITTFAKPTEGATLTVTATVRNPADIASAPGQDSAKLDTAPPAAPSGALAPDSDSGTKGDNRTNDTTPEITGTTEPNAKVEVTVNGKTYTTTADADGKYSVTVPEDDALPNGEHKPSIKVTDPAGNSTTKEGTPFNVDTSVQVLITDPGKGTTTNPISGTSEAGALVTVKDASGTTVGSATVGSDGKWTLTPTTAVPIGAVTASATDPVGNTATHASNNTGAAPAAPTITSVVDNLAGLTGDIQKYTPGNTGGLDKGITNDTTPTLNGTAVPGAVVTVYDAGVAIGSTTAASDGKWSFTPTTALAAGERVFTAGATLAGVSGPKTGDYPVLIDTSSPTTPVVDATGTGTNAGTGTGNTYSVIDSVGAKTGVVADGSTIDDASPIINGKGEAGATVSIFDKGVLLGTAVVGADGKWSFKPSTPFANGSTHTMQAA
jgi:hypothetical protein